MSVGVVPNQPMLPIERNYHIAQLRLQLVALNAAAQAGDLKTAALAAAGATAQLNQAGLDPQYQARFASDIKHPAREPLKADLDYLQALSDNLSVMGPATPVLNLTDSVAAQNPPSQFSIPQAVPPGGSNPSPVGGPISYTVGQNQAGVLNQGVQAPNPQQPTPMQSPSGSYSMGFPSGGPPTPGLDTPHRAF